MASYLIEISHADEHVACVNALRALEEYGSHFVTHAEWGCRDGVHSGWLIAELDSAAEALQLVPPQFRRDARVVRTDHFTKRDITSMIAALEA